MDASERPGVNGSGASGLDHLLLKRCVSVDAVQVAFAPNHMTATLQKIALVMGVEASG